MDFIPHTQDETKEMLKTSGASSLEDLFSHIPNEVRINKLNLLSGKSELEVVGELSLLSQKNKTGFNSFVGGGFYDHFIPQVINELAGRGEFYTPYTPYQAEASQGTLQTIFEFQSLISRLTGMEVANASLYDGGTAVYEAVMMAGRVNRKNKVIIDGNLNPFYKKMLRTHLMHTSLDLIELPVSFDRLDRRKLKSLLDDEVSSVVLQNPNFFGNIDDFSDISKEVHSIGALVIACVYPVSLGILKDPGDMQVDIAVGEGQSLGLPLGFGGPYFGFMATSKSLVRNMPGRLVGMAQDASGRRGFVLTLQTREQHIRRERATSNICTNEALCALRACIYLSVMGKEGLGDVADICARKTEYAKKRLSSIKGIEILNKGAVFNEFVIGLPKSAEDIFVKLLDKGILAGIPLVRWFKDMDKNLLLSFTEKTTRQEIDELVDALEEAL